MCKARHPDIGVMDFRVLNVFPQPDIGSATGNPGQVNSPVANKPVDRASFIMANHASFPYEYLVAVNAPA
jgi:hypothetical protein